MDCRSYLFTRQYRLELAACLEPLHLRRGLPGSGRLLRQSDGEALAPLGTTGIDHRPPASGLHANQKTMGPCPANLGRLVSAFHGAVLGGQYLG